MSSVTWFSPSSSSTTTSTAGSGSTRCDKGKLLWNFPITFPCSVEIAILTSPFCLSRKWLWRERSPECRRLFAVLVQFFVLVETWIQSKSLEIELSFKLTEKSHEKGSLWVSAKDCKRGKLDEFLSKRSAINLMAQIFAHRRRFLFHWTFKSIELALDSRERALN